jgi:16S rRNA (guanine527-N7)-methyltransferase
VPTPDWFSELLNRQLSPWISLSDSQMAQLYRHYDLLLRWNQRMNLTTVKPGPEMVLRHYCESLFFTAHFPTTDPAISVMDVGSGPGFPGVPIAILKPQWRVTLVESHQKKAVFLRESARHVANITVRAERMESVTDHADWIVSRAVDPTEVLASAVRLAPNIGLMLGEEDFSSIQSDSRIAWVEPVRLPWGDRRLCVYGTFHVSRGTSNG